MQPRVTALRRDDGMCRYMALPLSLLQRHDDCDLGIALLGSDLARGHMGRRIGWHGGGCQRVDTTSECDGGFLRAADPLHAAGEPMARPVALARGLGGRRSGDDRRGGSVGTSRPIASHNRRPARDGGEWIERIDTQSYHADRGTDRGVEGYRHGGGVAADRPLYGYSDHTLPGDTAAGEGIAPSRRIGARSVYPVAS